MQLDFSLGMPSRERWSPNLTSEATVYSLMAELPSSVPGSGSEVLLLAIVYQVPLQRALMIPWFGAKFAGIRDF